MILFGHENNRCPLAACPRPGSVAATRRRGGSQRDAADRGGPEVRTFALGVARGPLPEALGPDSPEASPPGVRTGSGGGAPVAVRGIPGDPPGGQAGGGGGSLGGGGGGAARSTDGD